MFILAFLLLPAFALAQQQHPPNPHEVALAFWQGMDADNDGNVSRADVDTYFANYDTDGDMSVSLDEFKVYITAAKPELTDYLDAAFGVFDINADGMLGADDFTAAFMAVDANGDSVASEQEFMDVFIHLFESIIHGHGTPAP